MKTIHFRIIELPDYQVLLTKDFDNEQDDAHFLITISFFLDGVKATLGFSYTKEKLRNKVFNQITETDAQGMVDNAKAMV